MEHCAADQIVLKDLTVYGSLPDRVGMEELVAMVAEGRLRLGEMITDCYPLEEAASALQAMASAGFQSIKTILPARGV